MVAWNLLLMRKARTAHFDQMSRFFVYEEYGARYESMLQDMTSTSLAIPNWQAYERGIEALANTLAPAGNREGRNKKGLTFGDLLIKVKHCFLISKSDLKC